MTTTKKRELKVLKTFVDNIRGINKKFYVDNNYDLDIVIKFTKEIEIRVRGKQIEINVASFDGVVIENNGFNKFVNNLSEARAIINILRNKVKAYYGGLTKNEKILEVI